MLLVKKRAILSGNKERRAQHKDNLAINVIKGREAFHKKQLNKFVLWKKQSRDVRGRLLGCRAADFSRSLLIILLERYATLASPARGSGQEEASVAVH